MPSHDESARGWLHELITGIRKLPPRYSFPLFVLLMIVALAWIMSHWRATHQQCGDINASGGTINLDGDHNSGILVNCGGQEHPTQLQ
jgi:hypothetical protein